MLICQRQKELTLRRTCSANLIASDFFFKFLPKDTWQDVLLMKYCFTVNNPMLMIIFKVQERQLL